MGNLEAQHYEREQMWEGYYNNPEVDKRALITIKSIPADSQKILDIGCGVGSITNRILKPFVVGMDLARTPLKRVSKHKFQGSVNSIPIKTKSFDTIIITEVLEHLSDQIFEETLREIERLGPKYILLSVPYDQCLETDYCKCEKCGNVFNIDHHYRSFKDESLKDLFKRYNISSVTYFGKCIPPNKFLTKLKHRLGIFYYSERTICDKCGSAPKNNKSIILKIIRMALGVPTVVDYFVKDKVLNDFQPSHQIVLFKNSEI